MNSCAGTITTIATEITAVVVVVVVLAVVVVVVAVLVLAVAILTETQPQHPLNTPRITAQAFIQHLQYIIYTF